MIVRAPAAGRILRVPQESARVVAAGELLVEIGDAAHLEITTDLVSTDAVKVRPGSRSTSKAGAESMRCAVVCAGSSLPALRRCRRSGSRNSGSTSSVTCSRHPSGSATAIASRCASSSRWRARREASHGSRRRWRTPPRVLTLSSEAASPGTRRGPSARRRSYRTVFRRRSTRLCSDSRSRRTTVRLTSFARLPSPRR